MMTSNKPHRIVYFGTPDFAAVILERLHADPDFKIVEVVTQPDKPVGRKRMLATSPVKRFASTVGLPVYQPETLKSPDIAAHLKQLGAEAFVVAAYGRILPPEILELPSSGCVNVHGSLLPKYRGASPISAAIAAGDARTGVTIMLMDRKMDEGPTLAESAVAINENDTTATLSERVAEAGAELLGPTLKSYFEGRLKPTPQDQAKATLTKILKRDDGRIDWRRTAEEIERFTRAMQPWPEAFTYWKKKGGAPLKLIVTRASVISSDAKCDTAGKIGGVCRLSDGTAGVNCGKGSLAILRLQLEGKPETDAKSFLNGHPDLVRAVLE